jgi:alkylation response protein AidB-like acyl-CoA dehydrogenase
MTKLKSSISSQKTYQNIPFPEFKENFRIKLHDLFHVRENIDNLSINRGMPPFIFKEILSTKPFSVILPQVYGGRGGNIKEIISIVETAGYESLSLALTLGINVGLLIFPLLKYGDESVKKDVFNGVMENQKMGGMMITEPDYGSDALGMKTFYQKENNHYYINGTKHWAGLTGWADYWLLTAREKKSNDILARDIDFFVCDVNKPGQEIFVEEKFNNLGLFMIPYGRNKLDLRVPLNHKLQPHTSGIKMMLDILHHSRLLMPGMGMGFIKRLLDEAIIHTQNRIVGGEPLFKYDQVQNRLAYLQSAFTICSAFCSYSSIHADFNSDLSMKALESNIIKTVTSDLMQEASQHLVTLMGASAYKQDNFAGRGIIDSRPFQIFEGSNDILYIQISETVIKNLKDIKDNNLYSFLKTYPISCLAADYVKAVTNFSLNDKLSQRKLVELGKVISRIFALGMVENMGHKGFKKELIENSKNVLLQEISAFMSVYNHDLTTNVVEDYTANSNWFNCID